MSPVLDVARRSKPTDLYAGSTDQARAPHRDSLDADAMLGPAIGGYLVREYGERAILADAGPGGHPSAGPFEMYPLQRSLLATLSVQGAGPDDVTDMVFYHSHVDHAGCATKGERLSSGPPPTGVTHRTGPLQSGPTGGYQEAEPHFRQAADRGLGADPVSRLRRDADPGTRPRQHERRAALGQRASDAARRRGALRRGTAGF